jgi:hypothetical protein
MKLQDVFVQKKNILTLANIRLRQAISGHFKI